jgi:hypothetical protein
MTLQSRSAFNLALTIGLPRENTAMRPASKQRAASKVEPSRKMMHFAVTNAT